MKHSLKALHTSLKNYIQNTIKSRTYTKILNTNISKYKIYFVKNLSNLQQLLALIHNYLTFINVIGSRLTLNILKIDHGKLGLNLNATLTIKVNPMLILAWCNASIICLFKKDFITLSPSVLFLN